MAKKSVKKPNYRANKGKYVGKVVREFRKGGEVYKIGESYNAIEENSYKYLINAGFIVSKK